MYKWRPCYKYTVSPFENPKTLNISIFNDVPMYGAWEKREAGKF